MNKRIEKDNNNKLEGECKDAKIGNKEQIVSRHVSAYVIRVPEDKGTWDEKLRVYCYGNNLHVAASEDSE